MALSIISLLITTTTVYAHLFNEVLRIILFDSNSKIELYLTLSLIILWAAIVGLVSSPTTGLAVEDDGAVFLGNMYYFSWAGFFNGIILLASIVEAMFGISVRSAFQSVNTQENNIHDADHTTIAVDDDADADVDTTTTGINDNDPLKTPSMAFLYWSALMTSSIIVMGSSSDIYNRNCEVENYLKPQPFCSRTTLGIVVGTISTIASLLIIAGKLIYLKTPFLIEVYVCFILFILYAVELMYVTRAEGPGSPLGNLYYFSWFSFMLCFGIGKCCYDDYLYALNVAEMEFEMERNRRTVGGFSSNSSSNNSAQQQQQQQQHQQQQQYTTVSSSGSPSNNSTSESTNFSGETKQISNTKLPNRVDDLPDVDI